MLQSWDILSPVGCWCVLQCVTDLGVVTEPGPECLQPVRLEVFCWLTWSDCLVFLVFIWICCPFLHEGQQLRWPSHATWAPGSEHRSVWFLPEVGDRAHGLLGEALRPLTWEFRPCSVWVCSLHQSEFTCGCSCLVFPSPGKLCQMPAPIVGLSLLFLEVMEFSFSCTFWQICLLCLFYFPFYEWTMDLVK